ncbi:MAG: hypothetical protein KatS3mg021_0881 [Fimbriimonadales bacterium]|nr:MAG: hypothetical protein KatS3mg021_0881 [Fimbriimonadales bacterium]
MRPVWALLLGMSIGWTQATHEANLSEDPRLQKPITVWVRTEPLRDALKAIQKQVGVPLICPDRLQSEKVAVFVENRPAHEVLTRLARVLRLRWETYNDGYRIERAFEETKLEEEALRIDREAGRKGMEAYLQMLRRVMAMTPEERRRRQEALKQALKNTETPDPLVEEELLFLRSLEEGWGSRALMVLASLPPAQSQRLVQEGTLLYSTHPPAGVNPLPPALWKLYHGDREPQKVQEMSSVGSQVSEVHLRRLSLGYRFSTLTNLLLLQVGEEKHYEPVSGDPDYMYAHCEYATYTEAQAIPIEESILERSALYQQWAEWSEPAKAIVDWINKRKPLPNRSAFPPGWQLPRFHERFGNFLSIAAVLEIFAWRYGIPVVADSYRVGALVVPEKLSETALLKSALHQCWARREGEYLLVRRQRYWAWRQVEPNEAVIRELEARFQRTGKLSIDDYARFVSALSQPAYHYFLERGLGGLQLGLGVQFPCEPLYQLPLLKFWGALAPAQRMAVMSKEFLPLRRMTVAQRKAFEHALEPLFSHPNRLLAPPAECGYSAPVRGALSYLFHGSSLSNVSFSEAGFYLLEQENLRVEKRLLQGDFVYEVHIHNTDAEEVSEEGSLLQAYESQVLKFVFQVTPSFFTDYLFFALAPMESPNRPAAGGSPAR